MDMTAPIAVRCALPDLQVKSQHPVSDTTHIPQPPAGLVHTKG